MRSWRLDLDGDAHAARLARHSIRGWLDLVDCDEDTKIDITLVASELVSDTVSDEAARVSIRMLFDDGRLRIDVHAERDQPPTATGSLKLQDSACNSLTDRVISAATDSWGRTEMPHGTHTWAEILC
jgi:hypothetical protein